MKIPIGGKVCMQHYPLLTASAKQQQQQQQQHLRDANGEQNEDMDEDVTDSPYKPDTMNMTPEMEERSSETLSGMESLLGTSHIKFQVKRKFVENLGDSSMRYLKGKLKKTLEETKVKFAESIVPGQGERLLNMLDNESSDDDSDDLPPDLRNMVQKYIDSDESDGDFISCQPQNVF